MTIEMDQDAVRRVLMGVAIGAAVLVGAMVARRGPEATPRRSTDDTWAEWERLVAPVQRVEAVPAAVAAAGPMRRDTRFSSSAAAFNDLLRELPDGSRILSCTFDRPSGIWQVSFERPASADPSPMEQALRRFLDGELPAGQLQISYSDLFVHSNTRGGGVRITVSGTGEVNQKTFSPVTPRTRPLSRDAVENLVRLLLELEAWEQHVLDAEPAGAVENLARLEIRAGDVTTRIWEQLRHREQYDRIARIGDAIKQLVWIDEQLAIIGE